MTSARVAVRTGAQDNAAAAKAIASSAVAKRAVNGIGEAGGARMTSEDRIGIWVACRGDEAGKVQEILKGHGAEEVQLHA